jgi:hypothetical protein
MSHLPLSSLLYISPGTNPVLTRLPTVGNDGVMRWNIDQNSTAKMQRIP